MSHKYRPEAIAAAMAALTDGASLDQAAEVVHELTGRRPSRGTVSTWAKNAGIDLAALARLRDPAAQTETARSVKAARTAAARDELGELLRDGISTAAAKLLAAKLARAAEAELVVEEAIARWRDALIVEHQAADFGPDAVKAARQATALARIDVMVAEASTPNAPELSLIVARAVRAYLQLTGEARADEEAGLGADALTVILSAPRPPRGPVNVVELTEET